MSFFFRQDLQDLQDFTERDVDRDVLFFRQDLQDLQDFTERDVDRDVLFFRQDLQDFTERDVDLFIDITTGKIM